VNTDHSIIGIFLVDDHEIVREGLKKVFTRNRGFLVVGEAGSANEALKKMKEADPQVVILDQHLPDGNGLDRASEIKYLFPQVRIVILTGFPLSQQWKKNTCNFVDAVLYKDSDSKTLRNTIRGFFEETPDQSSFVPQEHPLSHRERQVFNLLSTGMQNKEIAAALGLSERTIRNMVSRIFLKLGVGNRTEAALLSDSIDNSGDE